MSASRPTDRRNYICIIYLLFIRPRLVRGSTNYSRNIDKGKLEIRNRWLLVLLMYVPYALLRGHCNELCVCVPHFIDAHQAKTYTEHWYNI